MTDSPAPPPAEGRIPPAFRRLRRLILAPFCPPLGCLGPPLIVAEPLQRRGDGTCGPCEKANRKTGGTARQAREEEDWSFPAPPSRSVSVGLSVCVSPFLCDYSLQSVLGRVRR